MPRPGVYRLCPTQVAPSADQLSSHCVGFCKEFEVESVAAQQAPENGVGSSTAPASAAASAEPSPRTPEAPDVRAQAGCSAPAYCQCGRHWCCRECCGGASDGGMCRPLSHLLPCLQAQHLVAAEVPLRRTTTSNTAPRALMTFRGCPRPLGATIVLRGSDAAGKSLPGCLGSCCPCLPCPAHAGVGGLCRRGTHPQRCCSVPPQSSGR